VLQGAFEWYGIIRFLTKDNPESALTFTLAYLFINKPKSPVTIVDGSGDEHDTDHEWKFTKTAMRSNEEWIKKSWGNYYSINNQKAQYWKGDCPKNR